METKGQNEDGTSKHNFVQDEKPNKQLKIPEVPEIDQSKESEELKIPLLFHNYEGFKEAEEEKVDSNGVNKS